VARFATFDASPTAHAVLDPAFAALEARWSETTAHDAFVQLAASVGSLDAAAARYRAHLRARPGDEPAQRALAQIVLLATHTQAAAPNESVRLARVVYYAGVVVGIALFASVSILLIHVLRR
jgi:hypothetical protein